MPPKLNITSGFQILFYFLSGELLLLSSFCFLMYKINFNSVISGKINKIINQGIKMLINQSKIAMLKKDALQKLRIIFYVTMAIVFCFALQVGADEKTDTAATIKAAEQGKASAQYNLGLMYDFGKGIPQDYKKAVYWYIKAAEQGEALAQYNLGLMYEKGEGVPQDYKKAVYWYTKAAEQGKALAQYALGFMYEKGKGVPQDYITAYVWLNLSAANGHKNAVKNRDFLSRKMTSQQIAKSQESSVKFQNKIDRANKQPDSNNAASKTSKLDEQEIKSLGTGFFISRDGYILTCHHVIDGAESIKVIEGVASIQTSAVWQSS